jgi:hypothetical protein
MGHEVTGMRGVYGHITLGMRAELPAGLEALWEQSLRERASLAPTSRVAVLDGLLAAQQQPIVEAGSVKIGQFAPRIGYHVREPASP